MNILSRYTAGAAALWLAFLAPDRIAAAAPAGPPELDFSAIDAEVTGNVRLMLPEGFILESVYLKNDTSTGCMLAKGDKRHPVQIVMPAGDGGGESFEAICGVLEYYQSRGHYILTEGAQIVQGDIKLTGGRIEIWMPEPGRMKVRVDQSKTPGGARARLQTGKMASGSPSPVAAAPQAAALAEPARLIRLRRRARRRRISPRGVHALGLRPAGDSLLRAARFWLLAAALVWAARGAMAAAAPAFGAPGFGGAAGGNDIDLTADVIVFEQVNGQFTSMEANGRVKLLTEGLLVMCDRLLYDPASETMTASVSRSPKVYVETEQQKAECRRLTYHMKTGLFDLEGAAKVSYGEAVLQGDKMRIQSTSEGRFSVVSDSGAVSRSERQSPDAARDAAQAASQLREAFGTSIDIENILYGEGAQPASVTIRQDGSMKQSSSGAATPPPSGAIGPANLNAIPGSSGPKKMEIE